MKKAVLCVHDEELVGSLKNRLSEQGFAEIIVCSSAKETANGVLEKAPTLILLEGSPSPGTEITAAAQKIRERSSIPIIVIAERLTPEDISIAAESGVSAILTKPLRIEEFTATVQLSMAAARKVETLKDEVVSLKETLESRKVVEKAKGRLMERDKLTEAEAFRRMQRLAMDRRISMRQLAEAILLTDRIGN